MNVIFLDNGINAADALLPELTVDLEVTRDLKIVPRKSKAGLTHGTICAAIFHKYASNLQFGSIAVTDPIVQNASPEQLIKALEWCLFNKIDLINMSIGIENICDYPKVSSAVFKLSETGCKIVSARSNRMVYSFPSYMSEVIGVRTTKYLRNDQIQANPTPYDGINYLASSNHVLKLGRDVVYKTPIANSFAAPLITAKLAKDELNIQSLSCIGFGECMVDTSSPVLVITGVPDACVSFVSALYKKMLSEGLRTAVLSFYDYFLPEGWFAGNDTLSSIMSIKFKLNLDLLIVVTGQPQDIDYDMVIHLSSDNICIYDDSDVTIPGQRWYEHVDSLYSYILNIYEYPQKRRCEI